MDILGKNTRNILFTFKARVLFMKNKNRFFALFLIIIAFLLSSCGDFVKYIEEQDFSELIELQNSYIQELKNLSGLENYQEDEQRIYTLALQEGINEIKECDKIEKLEDIYKKNSEIILSIKTAKQYEEEKLEQERTLQSLKKEYIEKLNNISSITMYEEAEQKIYTFYLEQGIEALDKNEEIDKFEAIYAAYKGKIEEIKTKEAYIKDWHDEFYLLIEAYVDLEDYREEEQKSLYDLIEVTKESISKSDTYIEMENILRDFKIKVYSFSTDKELYDEELKEIKESAIEEIKKYKNLENYRVNEQQIIKNTLTNYLQLLNETTEKEKVLIYVYQYKVITDSIKDNPTLLNEELEYIRTSIEKRLLELITGVILSDEEKIKAENYLNNVKLKLDASQTKEELNRIAYESEKYVIEEIIGFNQAKEEKLAYLQKYLNKDFYRKEEQLYIDEIINKAKEEIRKSSSEDELELIVINYKEQLDQVVTNNELWQQEDKEFILGLREKYGDIFPMPNSLNEANDYTELAEIIDFYAFYQIDADSFERDTFRVRINWSHTSQASEIINNVKFRTHSLIYSVSASASFENDDYLIIKLFDGFLANKSNKRKNYDLYESKVVYGKTYNSYRNETFNDFAYRNYTKKVLVWNTQQLWMALQKGCLPICVEGSMAEIVLLRCEEILRSIINDAMNLEEKVFAIYTWLGKNVEFDYETSVDSTLDRKQDRSWYAEGAILDGLAVCSGYAKAYLMLLRIEGINAYLIPIINGRHEYCYIQMSDGLWYYSDPCYSIYNNHISYLFFAKTRFIPTYLKENLSFGTFAENFYHSMKTTSGQSLVISNSTNAEIIVQEFKEYSENSQLSLFYYRNADFDLKEFLISNNIEYFIPEHHYGLNSNLDEIIIFK